MIEPQQLRETAIRPALLALSLHSMQAENLELATAAAESGLRLRRQMGGGPALGLWQMEPATHSDIWGNYLKYRPALADAVQNLAPREFWSGDAIIRVSAECLVDHDQYAAAMVRVHYRRARVNGQPDPLPAENDWAGMARYWKLHYNTPHGKGTVEHFMAAIAECRVAVPHRA